MLQNTSHFEEENTMKSSTPSGALFLSLYKGDSVEHAVFCVHEPDKLPIAYAKIREFYGLQNARKFKDSKKMAILYETFFLDCSLFSHKVCPSLLPNRQKKSLTR